VRYQEAEQRAAVAAAALLEEEGPTAIKEARKGKRKKKKKGQKQGALPPPEQAPASPLEEPSETPDDTQVRFVNRYRHLVTVGYQRLSGVNGAMRTFRKCHCRTRPQEQMMYSV
jgi:hypothetical protein